MDIKVNLEDEQESPSGLQVNLDADLPDGVYNVGAEIPPERVEIFRVNDRIYTLLRQVDPRVVFRMIKEIHTGGGNSDIAQANLLYEVLGAGVIDFLAEEKLEPEQYAQVMKAVQKHTMKSARVLLGN